MIRAEAIATLVSINYRNWELLWNVTEAEGRDMLGFAWSFPAPDAYDPNVVKRHQGRKHFAFVDELTEEALVRRAFEAVRLVEEHEAREFFTYQDKKPFDPHKRLI